MELTPAGWGLAVAAVAAALFGLAGARALPGAWPRRVGLVVLMATAGLVARAVIAPPQPIFALGFDAGLYAWAAGFLVVGAAAAVALLRGRERRGLLAPVLAVITGLHVVGLWLATGQRLFVGVALGLVAAGLIALGWARGQGPRDPRPAIAGLGSALVLWAGCLSSLA